MTRLLRGLLGLCLPMASEATPFPSTFKGFGLAFNQAGELRELEGDGETVSDRPFTFEAKPGDKAYNQARYEALGEVVTEEVYHLLETRGGLLRKEVAGPSPRSFVFASPGFESKERLLLLIHGSGVVRAGQWARRLIINDSLDKGTVLPFLEEASKEEWGVVVLNTNLWEVEGEKVVGSGSPEEHAATVWRQMVQGSKAERVVVVAHSYGGVVAVHLASTFGEEWRRRVAGLLMTDSVHGRLTGHPPTDLHLAGVGRNWVTSTLTLGTSLPAWGSGGGIERVSAGVEQHELTTWAAASQIFEIMGQIKRGTKWKEEKEVEKKVVAEEKKAKKEETGSKEKDEL